MKTSLWVIAVIASGAVGFYFGAGYGAKTLGRIVAQNEVTIGLAIARLSIDALERNDLSHSNMLLQENLKSALLQLGTHSQGLDYWKCSDKDRETIKAAQEYAKANPTFFTGPMQQFTAKGLEFCHEKSDGYPVDA